MKSKFTKTIALTILSLATISSSWSQDKLTADDVLKTVRSSYTKFDREFEGMLRMGLVKKIPFRLILKPDSLRFAFNGPDELLHLNTKNKGFSLLEGPSEGQLNEVSPQKYEKKFRGTDATYDDLSMRFLYWPNGSIVKESKYKTLDTWLIKIPNPDAQGLYQYVNCWIDKASGGLIKMEAHNKKGRLIRRFEVLSGKQFGDVWMVNEMRIESISSASSNVTSSTRMKITERIK